MDITLPEVEEAEDMVSFEEAEDMVSLRRNVTGVDATVFVSTKGYGQHAPACIQIAVGDPASLNAATAGLASMAIRDCALTGAAPPPHIVETASHSISCSARSRKGSEIASPSALAVLRLITSANLVGCWTGRSEGLAPFKILST
jgi:hypothetical protein